jgi:hypothetical protein
MQQYEGKKVRIEFIEDVEIDVYLNDDPNEVVDVYRHKKGDTSIVELVEVSFEQATFYWTASTCDELDLYATHVPINCFKIIEVQKIIWEEV